MQPAPHQENNNYIPFFNVQTENYGISITNVYTRDYREDMLLDVELSANLTT